MAEQQQQGASGLTWRQEQALAICPKISASISIPCSCFIIYEVWTQHKRKGSTAVQRALLAMSLVDILASSAWFLSTWAVPQSSGFAYSAGNRTTCNLQGFLLQLAIGAPLYNSSLAIFYLLMIKMRWTDHDLIKMERFIHLFILTFTLGTSTLLLPLHQYNHIGAVCWVIGEPTDCGNSSFHPNPEMPCERGDYAWVYGLALFYVPLWVCVIACCLSMACLYREVRITHMKSQRYLADIGIAQPQRRSGGDTDRVATQAMLYSLSFLVTWMPSTLWSIAHWFNFGNNTIVYALSLAAAIAEPLQGLWNLLIFLRSRPRTILRLQNWWGSLIPSFDFALKNSKASSNSGGLPYNSRSFLFLSTTTLKVGHGDVSSAMMSHSISKERTTIIKSSEAAASVVDLDHDEESAEETMAEDISSDQHQFSQHYNQYNHHHHPSTPFDHDPSSLSSSQYTPSKMMDYSSDFMVISSSASCASETNPEPFARASCVATLDTSWHHDHQQEQQKQEQEVPQSQTTTLNSSWQLPSNNNNQDQDDDEQTPSKQQQQQSSTSSQEATSVAMKQEDEEKHHHHHPHLDWEITPEGGRVYDC